MNLYGFVGNDGINASDHLGLIKVYNEDVSTYPVTSAQMNPSYRGLARISFFNRNRLVKIDEDYCRVKMDGLLDVKGLHYSNLNVNHPDYEFSDVKNPFHWSVPNSRNVRTTPDHEKYHLRINSRIWNDFVKDTKPYREKMCCDCATLALLSVEAMKHSFREYASYTDAAFDIASYGKRQADKAKFLAKYHKASAVVEKKLQAFEDRCEIVFGNHHPEDVTFKE